MSEEEFEEMEDRRRMQQQILRDKLVQADSRKTPDPTMTVQMTTNTGFALGTFDMSESLAIVEDLLDYFGEDELAALDLDGDDRFNESQLIEAERCHLERESLVRHLYDSEEDYLRSLQEIQSCYQQPLLRNLQHPEAKKGLLGTGGSSGKPVATKEEIETLFGNLDQLVEFHEGIRTMLEARSKIWGPTQIMSDLLLQVIPRFKIYSRYFTNFHAALTVLDRISRTPQYKKFMEQCVADSPPGTASLHLMLAFPLKRLSTYRDLICAICRATQPDHPDYYNLMRAQEAVHMVAAELRQERIMAQDQLALWDVQSNMVGLPEPIMMSPQGTSRRLILRADLHKVDASLQLEPRTYYLLNDVLLYARFDPKKNVYQYKGMFELARSQVKNAEDNPTLPQLPNSIQLSNQGRKQMMKLRSREERDHWLETMRETIEIANKMAPLSDAPIRKDVLPLFSHPNSDTVSTNSANANGNSKAGSTHGNGSLLGNGSTHGNSSLYGSGGNTPRTFSDSRSVTSKSSNETSGSGSKPGTTRKANPADFYGSSFGADVAVNPNEDNYHNYRSSPLALSTAMSNNSSSSSVSTGITTGSKGSSNSGKQSLGAMLAAIPVEQLTPKQAKAKAALAAAVEARRQERLKRELKSGASSSVKSEMNKNVNFDFSSSFIPAKERIAKT
ncbi:hypothetical protein BGZ83_011754 [Gryganskiella cystojenkinii]|nr:hypothetical protein BGZ83_011754 [Gryganskiella cystojenkinii]